MDKQRNSPIPHRPALEQPTPEHPTPAPMTPREIGTFASGGVPVRRNLISLARRLFQICTTAAAETLEGQGLTTLQFGTIVYLSKVTGQPDIDQNGLAARLGIDRASTSQIVEELVAMGLVDRRVNGADRRARLLCLTPRGEKLRARLHPAQIAGQWRILASLAPRERELLLDLVVRVVESNNRLARPGSGRRKRGSRQSTADQKNRQSPSNQT
jgi:DNA-binding MarR family transcriptional regulator